MPVTTGITPTSVSKFVVDAGAVYLNYGETDERLLGATRGGATFEIEQEIRTIEIDGSKGATMGARRVTGINAKITANLMELSTENLMVALAGSTSTLTDDTGAVGTTHNNITRAAEITDASFVTNIALVGKVMGKTENFVGIIFNALSDGGFSMETSDKDEVVLEVQFTAHYDPANMALEPWAIRNPVSTP